MSTSREALRLVLRGSSGEKRVPLARERLLIGRGPDADVDVDDEQVSRRHALLLDTEHGLLVVDLQSQSGVIVGGRRVSHAFVPAGLCFRVGKTELWIERSSPAPVAPTVVGEPVATPPPAMTPPATMMSPRYAPPPVAPAAIMPAAGRCLRCNTPATPGDGYCGACGAGLDGRSRRRSRGGGVAALVFALAAIGALAWWQQDWLLETVASLSGSDETDE